MSDKIEKNVLEAEIEELSNQIEERRAQLESEHGFIEEKEVLREVVAEKFDDASIPVTSAQVTTPQDIVSDDESYLDTLDDESHAKVSTLIAVMQEKGLAQAILNVKDEKPVVVDAFHDALVDKLYDTLKERGIIK